MFLPRYFRVTETRHVVELIRQNSLGILISTSGSGVADATHIPFLVNDELSELKGHMASANCQWKGLDGKEVLTVFQGPNHYISPEWYGEEMQVPTWNYAIAHVRGIFHLVEGESEKIDSLDEMVTHYETTEGEGWSADWSRKEYLSMLSGIVVFRISVKSVEGKWKLSQNHPEKAVQRTADKLSEAGNRNSAEVARLMREAGFSDGLGEK